MQMIFCEKAEKEMDMASTSPQAPQHNSSPRRFPGVPALLLFLFAIGVPSAAALTFAHAITQNPWQWLAIGLLYEVGLGSIGFWGKVWQRLERSLVDRTASWIEIRASIFFSRAFRRYRTYLIHEHEVFDIKGLSTLPDWDLELEQVFVQLDVNPTPIHQALADPIKVPETLRDGPHDIWAYLGAKAIRSRHFVITGAPGSGKTTLLKHLALSLARGRKTGVPHMPVLLYLRDHATTLDGKYDASTDTFAYSLAEAVNAHMQRKWQQLLPLPWIRRKLAKGQCLVLLDGLDEVADARLRQLVVKWVQRQMLAYGRNRFILTSRPQGYRDNPLEGVWVLGTRPFTPVQVAQFVQNWYQANEYNSWQKKDPGMQMRAREGAHDLLRRLYRTPALLTFAVNPLLLTMIATVHRYRDSLPGGSRVALYDEICEVFLGKRREALGLVQELSSAQMQQVLRPLAYYLMQQGKREIELEEACQVIAPHLLRVSTRIPPDEFLRIVQNSSGLLLERNPGSYGFAHKTFQEYLTAVYIKEQRLERELVARVQEDWWHETIRLYCAQADASGIIEACLAHNPPPAGALALALDCAEEKLTIEPVVKAQLDTLLEKGREDPDLERRRVIAEALLRRRLDQMVHLHDEVFVDTSFVTCAEYQLFLDERAAQGRYHQPEHWSTTTFPPGQGHVALLGMRPADVRAFCEWLTERDAGIWRYRMPTMSEHQQIEVNLQGMCKFASGTGYWVNEGQAFVWVGGKVQPLQVKGSDKTFDTFAFDIAGDLALARDCASALARAGDLALALASAGDLALALDRASALASASDLARAGALASALASDLARAGSLYHDLDRDLDRTSALARALASVLDLARASSLVRDLALTRAGDLAHALALDRASDLALASDLARAGALARDLASDLERTRARDLDRALALALASALASALTSALTRIDILARKYPIDIRITLLLVRTLIYSRALERVLSYPVSTPSRRWWLGPVQRKSTDWTDEGRRWSIYFALKLYVDLLIIEGRRVRQLPAWEGILLVKESKQAG